ncbi:MAG: heavy-metal-associated domain-containing protein [Chitinophagales bacterium]
MKKILLSFFSIYLCTLGYSQVTVKGGVATATISTPTVQCEECKQRIEKYVIREEGVQKVVVDYKRKVTKVTYVMERTNIENVKTAIANAGYDADDVPAEQSAYQKLPTCCKKTSDGGGHEK